MSTHAIWWLITMACIAWYSTMAVYVAIKGVSDIRNMLVRLEDNRDKKSLLLVLVIFALGDPSGKLPLIESQLAVPYSLSQETAGNPLRIRYTINFGWKFLRVDQTQAELPAHDDSSWSTVNLPHTWNVEDSLDDTPGYHRGTGWYRRNLPLDTQLQGKRLFLYFEGANQVTDVYINGRHAGQHMGGYTAFVFEITEYVQFGATKENLIAVKVNNSHDNEIPPLNADFNFYGGIYRDVWLVVVAPIHITLLDHASSGLHVDTPQVSAERALVRVRGKLVNGSNQARQIEVTSTVIDAGGRQVASLHSTLKIEAQGEASFAQTSPPVIRPNLWSPDHPYLYAIRTIVSADGRAADEVTTPLGFRWFSFDAERGFFLNGKHLKLKGTNRHQDYAGLGSAMPDALHVRDLEIIKETGFNFLRLAHYPQDPSVLEAADRLGLIIWEEIPIVNEITVSPVFTENSKRMLTQMIRQHRNHPSIVLWGYMNEVFLRQPAEEKIRATVALARELETICRREDPSRFTTIAFDHGARDIYNSSGLGDVTQVIGWNLYHGWYYEEFADFGKFIDEQHRRFPGRPLIISEYGANGDTRLHSLTPKRYDSTMEWQRRFHENCLPQINARQFIAGSAIWNQFDFGSEFRGETIPHINQKGMFTFDRRRETQAASTSRNVLNTTEDPLYQTMQQGLAGYRFDVPDGKYEIELRFVEYEFTKPGQRVFTVSVNNDSALPMLDLARQFGPMQAAVLRLNARAAGGKGLLLDFASVTGRPVLSAIRVRRIF